MQRCVFGTLAALCFATLVSIAGDKVVSESSVLQGTWQAVDLEGNGQKCPDEQVRELQVVVKGEEIYAVKPQGEDPHNTFKVDPSKEPKTIDLFPVDGPKKGQLVAGIYSIEKGRLRICINIFGKDTAQRPTTFTTQEGDGHVFVILERVNGK